MIHNYRSLEGVFIYVFLHPFLIKHHRYFGIRKNWYPLRTVNYRTLHLNETSYFFLSKNLYGDLFLLRLENNNFLNKCFPYKYPKLILL